MNASLIFWRKQMKKTMVHAEEVFGMLFQPILWVVLFGVGMRSFMGSVTAGSGTGYMTFILPGIIALTAVGAAIGGGSTWLNERLAGIIKEYLVAPIPRLSILMGSALSITTTVLIQAIVILVVGVVMGARLSTNPLGWIGGFLLIAGYGIGFSGIALAVASRTDSPAGYHMMIFLLQLPLLFLSNSLYPLAALPSWMQIGALVNPTTYVVTGLRFITMAPATDLSSVTTIPLWICFCVITVFALAGLWLALRAFNATIK